MIVGIGAISGYFFATITRNIDDSIEQNFAQQGDILSAAIEKYMIPGEAELAVEFFNTLQQSTDELSQVRLIRTDGESAFSDLTTVEDVVKRVPGLASRFANPSARIESIPNTMVEEFEKSIEFPPGSVTFTEEIGDSIYAGAYIPLLNKPECTYCHGSDHTIRGVIDIRQNITVQRNRQFEAGILSGSLFVSVVLMLTVILSLFMRRTIVKPVKTIGAVCAEVTEGDFDRRVSVKSRDEIGRLGETVNQMVEGLHERFELQKYVSSKTLESLLGEKTGESTSLTMLFTDIRDFTKYTENRSAEHVVTHLNAVLNVQSEIIQRFGGDIDKYVGDEIVAMFSHENQGIDSLKAAAEIQAELEAGGAAYDGLRVGIGINTGEVILGMIGSERRADYTFIGDNVNTASRLCDAAEPGGILISGTTYELVKELVEYEGPFRLKVKGKSDYIKVFKISKLGSEV